MLKIFEIQTKGDKMKNNQKERLNRFFVHVFNQILSWEEKSFKESGITDITLRELHVIEAVYHLIESRNNKMADIAEFLSITPGSLTTSVNILVKKGYLKREGSESDRRVVYIVPTEKAAKVNEIHTKFHSDMIDEALPLIDGDRIEPLLDALERLEVFFEERCGNRK